MSASQALKTVATTMSGPEMAAVAKQTAAQVGSATVKKFFEANKGTLLALLPKHFDAERMLKLALGALRTTPKLANASNSSLLGAVVTCAQLGLEPNTPLGHAYLLPFDKREKRDGQWVTVETQVTIIIGYKGMLDLARRSGQIVSIAAHEVCENDDFSFAYGLDEELVHRPAMTNRGAVIGFYAVAKLVGGGHCFEFMSTDEVNHIRDKAAEKNRAKKGPDGRPIVTGPWADNYVEMGRKTALRRLFKYLPISIENLAFADAIDGNAVAAAAPLDEMVLDMSQEGDNQVEQQDEALRQIEQKQSTTIPQQTRAQATVPHDAETGEIHDPASAQQQQDDGPTFADAHAAVRDGDFDLALDIARSLPDGQRKQIEAAIANLEVGGSGESENPAPGEQKAASRRGRGQMSLD
jgi:recombination protein RecT